MRVQTTREERMRLVESWRSSGQSIGAFARCCGIPESTFQAWVVRERRKNLLTPDNGFLEVVGSKEVEPEVESVGEVRLTVGRVDVRFPVPPPPAWVAELVRELSRC